MNIIVKLIAPATLALAAFGANAGVTEIDYPADVIQSHSVMSGDATAAAASIGAGLNLLHSESAVREVPAKGFVAPTREEVRDAITQPSTNDVGYFA